jgi:non-canonical poly(A) RNA polymerase PAPD5/7
MMRFHEYIKPSRTEALARRQLVEQVRSHVREVIPDAALEVFGSERTGLAFATSDIDLRLLKFTDMEESASSVLPPSKQQRIRLLDDIYRLFRHLRKNSQYEHCVVLHARYPLVSLRDKASGLDVQIVLSNDTSLSRAMIRKYIEEYPFIRPVYSVVKTMFDIRGLSDTFRGGFGSYSIFMMIVASFRHCDWKTPPTSAGEGLKAFIDFWTVFDTTKNGISLEPTELYDKAIDAPMTDTVRAKLQVKSFNPISLHLYYTNSWLEQGDPASARLLSVPTRSCG